jgi:hypothetical protein
MCAIEKTCEIEVTSEMADLGADVILSERGVAEIGVFFSAPDLAVKVFLAMESARLSRLDQ